MNPQHSGRKLTKTPVMLKRDIPVNVCHFCVVILYEVFLLGKGKVLLSCFLRRNSRLPISFVYDRCLGNVLRVAMKERVNSSLEELINVI